MSDPYIVLGVDRSADDATIKAAFRKLAVQYHPDKNPGNPDAEAKFKEINSAYQDIETADKRRSFDNQGQGNNFQWRTENFDFEGTFGVQFEEILRNFHSQHQPRQRNRHYNTSCHISLHDAFNGCDISVSTNEGHFLKVTVPPGIDNGIRLRIPEAGEKTHGNSPPGDLFVSIYVDEHPLLKRNGKTIISEVTVDAIDAMTGSTVSILTIDGETLNIDFDAGIQYGHQIRIDSKGMPALNDPSRGDHIVVVKIVIPVLNDEQKTKLKSLRTLETSEETPK